MPQRNSQHAVRKVSFSDGAAAPFRGTGAFPFACRTAVSVDFLSGKGD